MAPMTPRLIPVVFALVLLSHTGIVAQTRVQTETIKPPDVGAQPSEPDRPGAAGDRTAAALPDTKPASVPEILTDLSSLPAPVARMRARILEAARSGDLEQVVTVMQSGATMPVFSFGDEKSPIAFWKASYPDSHGLEVLAILIEILEAGFVRVDAGTPQEMFVWPYFAFVPLKDLTPPQKVELFKIVTGPDYKEMQEFGAYIFYRLGIGPGGAWHFFITGD